MEESKKVLEIEVPQGYEIDKENSTFEKIVFKKVEEKLTYEKIAENLFLDKNVFYTNKLGQIENGYCYKRFCNDLNNAPTSHQLERLMALNKLTNVAYYLNEGWEPNWEDDLQTKYFIFYNSKSKTINIDCNTCFNKGVVYFKSKELAKQAVEILGEETINLALGVI